MLPFILKGQTNPKGCYCTRDTVFRLGSCWTFKNNSLFEYRSWDRHGEFIGKGIYKILNNTLTVKFKGLEYEYPAFGITNGAIWKIPIKIIDSVEIIIRRNKYEVVLKKETE
ncbi:MAG: hypothetical protein J0L54_15880 [Chitinophagales bacterium]|nr:hypothetical protein [Chitinophagales bacterium]